MTAGRVTVDGREVRDLAFTLDPSQHEVRVDGELVAEQPKHYFALNKPAGYVCTHRDPAGRPKAVDLVPIPGLALFTVGRLDESSEGLLIVTNDGDLANRLAHPRYRIERTYHVEVAGIPTGETLQQLRRGLYFEEGRFRMHGVRVIRSQGRGALLEVVLTEGKNREIRRLLARVGHKVTSLTRVSFGSLRLAKLPTGEFRPLTEKEVAGLQSMASARRRRKSAEVSPPAAGAEGNESQKKSRPAGGGSAARAAAARKIRRKKRTQNERNRARQSSRRGASRQR